MGSTFPQVFSHVMDKVQTCLEAYRDSGKAQVRRLAVLILDLHILVLVLLLLGLHNRLLLVTVAMSMARESPRWDLNSKVVSACSTPKIGWSDLIVLVGSLSISLKLVPCMDHDERYACRSVSWVDGTFGVLVVDQLGGVPLIGSSG
ncbi:hypothetical protein KY290_036238 [Solanum tuberosum]|uniref:Uncharacterized protein n=1 Tax=Solanum tuberosum TaxID=4113 RepID=A0ABQ7TSW5_SOLTU|nr:hypothetical protein KY290_036238 [Solanum tuberosum]